MNYFFWFWVLLYFKMFYIFALCCFFPSHNITAAHFWVVNLFVFFHQMRQSRFAKSDMKPESTMLGLFFFFLQMEMQPRRRRWRGRHICMRGHLVWRELNVSSAYSRFCALLFQHHPSLMLVKLKELFKETRCFFTLIYWMSICLRVIILHFFLWFKTGFSREM